MIEVNILAANLFNLFWLGRRQVPSVHEWETTQNNTDFRITRNVVCNTIVLTSAQYHVIGHHEVHAYSESSAEQLTVADSASCWYQQLHQPKHPITCYGMHLHTLQPAHHEPIHVPNNTAADIAAIQPSIYILTANCSAESLHTINICSSLVSTDRVGYLSNSE